MTSLEMPSPRSIPRLAWTDASGTHEVELYTASTVGSAPGCDIVIGDRAVSRLHAEFAPREDGVWVRDLSSRNGTFVGGIRVAEARIPNATNVRFGVTEITVAYGPAEAAPEVWPERHFEGLVAESAKLREIFARVAKLAQGEGSVLFVGETGTGKEGLARALHEASPRGGGPFVTIDCAALPEPSLAADLLDSAIGQAEGGMLHLDEPQELPMALQRELVSVFEANAFRIVTTSTRDLRPLVNYGAFRESLYFRIAGTIVEVPPLREHIADLKPLLEHFLEDQFFLVTPGMMDDLVRLAWPGNVRELRVVAERIRRAEGRLSEISGDPGAFAMPTTEIDLRILDETAASPAVGAPAPITPRLPTGFEPWFESGFKDFRERWIELGEREYLRRLMLRTRRSSSVAAREAGLERTYLYRLLKKHDV